MDRMDIRISPRQWRQLLGMGDRHFCLVTTTTVLSFVAVGEWRRIPHKWQSRQGAGLPRRGRHSDPGVRLFVDYAGQTVELVDPSTGEIRQAQVFLAVLGASSYIYAEARPGPRPRRTGSALM